MQMKLLKNKGTIGMINLVSIFDDTKTGIRYYNESGKCKSEDHIYVELVCGIATDISNKFVAGDFIPSIGYFNTDKGGVNITKTLDNINMIYSSIEDCDKAVSSGYKEVLDIAFNKYQIKIECMNPDKFIPSMEVRVLIYSKSEEYKLSHYENKNFSNIDNNKPGIYDGKVMDIHDNIVTIYLYNCKEIPNNAEIAVSPLMYNSYTLIKGNKVK